MIRPKGVDAEDAARRDQLHGLAESVLAWTGNHAGVSEIAETDLAKLRRRPPPVLKDVRADGD